MKTLITLAALAIMSPALAGDSPYPVVNVNTASIEQLEFLPGIGPVLAHRIAEMAVERPFRKVAELIAIKGIGEKTLAKIAPFCVIEGETTAGKDISPEPYFYAPD